MANHTAIFKALHHTDKLFLLPNAWDARSAQLFQQQGFSAIGTSSAAVATSLGYADGEGMPLDEYLLIIKRIIASVSIPVTVDFEMGYANTPEAIYANLQQLIALGVAGINLEDSLVKDSQRTLRPYKDFAATLQYIKKKLAADKLSLFINVRCDTYLLDVPDKQVETLTRLKAYETAGADGILLPCIGEESDITAAVSHTILPLNVMCIPGLPDLATLNKLGVKRASMGPFLFNKVYSSIGLLSEAIQATQSFASLFS